MSQNFVTCKSAHSLFIIFLARYLSMSPCPVGVLDHKFNEITNPNLIRQCLVKCYYVCSIFVINIVVAVAAVVVVVVVYLF